MSVELLFRTSHHSRLVPQSASPSPLSVMGFLKRWFSVGSKKSKSQKKAIASEYDPSALRRHQTNQTMPLVLEDAEATASRLLRSASARLANASEPDFHVVPHLRKLHYLTDVS